MRKRINWEWELLHDVDSGNVSESASRAKVIGGWIVAHARAIKGNCSESMVFIPDRDHEWEILKPLKPKTVQEIKSSEIPY